MTFDKVIEELEECNLSTEGREAAMDAVAFVTSLHQLFKDSGMTTEEEPNLDEMENLVDALHGELGAAVLFFCEPSFQRVPDMLRGTAAQIEKWDDQTVVPPTIVKGFVRLAKRIENTRVNQQQLAATMVGPVPTR